jgi:hypothetical protein
VAMPDRRSAPIFAAAAAFVLVLVFGKVIDSGSSSPGPSTSGSPTPTSAATSSPTASPKPGSTGKVGSTITTTPSALDQLTVVANWPFDVTGGGTGGGVANQSIQVEAVPEEGNDVTGTLSPSLAAANGVTWNGIMSLDAGTYQVCLQPPSTLKAANASISSDPQLAQRGFFCKTVRLASAAQTVSFKLVTG